MDYEAEMISDDGISATVTACAWLWRRGEYDLALAMRDEFLDVYGYGREVWNRQAADIAEYAIRKAGETDAQPFVAVCYPEPA